MIIQLAKSFLALSILTIGLPAVSSADLTLAFSDDGGASFAESFTQISPGDTSTISIFVQELPGSTGSTLLSSAGLIGFGIEVATDTTAAANISAVTQNPLFDFVSDNSTTPTGFVLEAFELANTGVSGESVFLASFEFQSTTDGITNFNVLDNIPGDGVASDSFLTPTLDGLDSQIFSNGPFNFTVTTPAIPEPNVACMLLLMFPVATFSRRR